MATNLITALLFFFFLTLHVHGGGSISTFNKFTSCSQLPHPKACYSLTQNAVPLYAGDKAKSGFREFNIQGAMSCVRRAHLEVSTVDIGKFDSRTRGAWDDCVALAENTIENLQNSVEGQSSEETQTWLSAAIANQQTCADGFSELRLIPPPSMANLLSRNITELLSNSLAVNAPVPTFSGWNRKLLSGGGGGGDDDDDSFPEWLSDDVSRRLLRSVSVKADLVVAKDGSGNYKSIKEAVSHVAGKRSGNGRFVIHVKAGVYKENVEIKKSMKNLMFIGDGIDRTIVTGKRSVKGGWTTFRSATFAVDGKGFIAKDMTFENTSGPKKHQAVALRSDSDLSVFYRCSFKGYQDTLYVHSNRQFYRECDVYGTVDFIFGDAAVVLQSCNIHVRKPMRKQKNTVTAQGRSDPNENTGISIHNSVVKAASDFRSSQRKIKTFLGRPWKRYSRTVFMKSNLGGLIAQAGWLEWNGNFALKTLYYGEYSNTGAGASTRGRVKWGGYHVMSSSTARKFTVGSFLAGNSWIPATRVPFTSHL